MNGKMQMQIDELQQIVGPASCECNSVHYVTHQAECWRPLLIVIRLACGFAVIAN